MVPLRQFLEQNFRENIPHWLIEFNPGDQFPREEFFSSRIVFYPGSGFDGQPVATFGSAHAAHCFIYVDYLLERNELGAQLDHRGFRGYRRVARVEVTEAQLAPNGWIQHVSPPRNVRMRGEGADPFCFLEILEREADLDDAHGAQRLAILFLYADGFAAFDALFCQPNGTPPPFAVVVQDHGWGGNYDRFGGGGLLEDLATQCSVLPELLLVSENTECWDNYHLVPDVCGEAGGMHRHLRRLYRR